MPSNQTGPDAEMFAITADSALQVFTFESSGDAYDAAQCCDDIKTGAALIVESESAVALAWAWPVAVTAALSNFHALANDTRDDAAATLKDMGVDDDTARRAVAEARKRGFAIAPAWAALFPAEEPAPAAPVVTLTADGTDSATADWSDASGRFHVWFYRRTQRGMMETTNARVPIGPIWIQESVIYKNPPLASDGRPLKPDAPGYFDTRLLDLNAKANASAAARIRELATPEALDALTAAFVAERDARNAAENRAARVAYLAKCVAAIQAASADDLGAAVLESSVETARAAELLRMAGEKTERLAAAPVRARLAEIRNAARVIHFASPEELTAAAPPAKAERTDESGRRYIDMTPSWAGVLPVFMAALTDGNATGQAAARTELHRMARAADSAVLVASIAKGA